MPMHTNIPCPVCGAREAEPCRALYASDRLPHIPRSRTAFRTYTTDVDIAALYPNIVTSTAPTTCGNCGLDASHVPLTPSRFERGTVTHDLANGGCVTALQRRIAALEDQLAVLMGTTRRRASPPLPLPPPAPPVTTRIIDIPEETS